jgi:Cys-tRNA(Pro)/Cys-tRNA(Cys) deacylase
MSEYDHRRRRGAVKEQKTNAMRILEQKKIPYKALDYPHGDGPVDGVSVAQLTGQDPATVFKTLVTVGASRNHYVFVIPVMRELDLKKAAAAVGEKSIAMIHVSEITPLTGYVRGGCSPVGMKKLFRTVFDASAEQLGTIQVSGGRIGTQISLAPADLIALVRGETADITTEE